MPSITRADAVAKDKLLPKFDEPPVVETVLNVQFESLPKFKTVHLGLFLSHLGDEWGNASDAPPLPPQFERFEPVVQWENLGIQFEVTQEIALRMQVRNKANDRMIQLQNGRLSFNWLGETGQGYPSYSKVRPEFEAVLGQFRRFISAKTREKETAAPAARYARMSSMTRPSSISSRCRPGTARRCGSRPRRCRTVAWMSVT